MSCYVYLIESDAPAPPGAPIDLNSSARMFKIGVSANVKSRLATLQTASPYRLQLNEAWAAPSRALAAGLERTLHTELDRFRVCGEWFFADPIGLSCEAEGIVCIEAVEVWCMSPREAVQYFIAAGKPEDWALDAVGAEFGIEATLA
jgi:hypothetical protein